MSRLMDDLNQVPAIVASLGLAIAESQKEFDTNYLKRLQNLAVIAQGFLGPNAEPGQMTEFIKFLVQTAAPARYQFTETTLNVKLDLAESRDSMTEGGLGFGFAGVVVNAAFAYGYSQDYRAGAEVRAVIHAVLPQSNESAFSTLLNRAKELSDKPLELPAGSQLDKDLLAEMKKVAELVDAKVAPIKTEEPAKEK